MKQLIWLTSTRILTGITFFVLLVGCDVQVLEDDDPTVNDPDTIVMYPDTVENWPYFPVYPNSCWVYLNTTGDTAIHKTDTTYVLFSSYNPINMTGDTIKHYAPLYDGHLVSGYSIYMGSHSYHESGWKTILPNNLTVGNLFTEQYIWPGTYYSGQIMTIDTSLVINSVAYDSVLIVKEFLGPAVGILPKGKTYYAKNIGIIKFEYIDQATSLPISEENLIWYKIGSK